MQTEKKKEELGKKSNGKLLANGSEALFWMRGEPMGWEEASDTLAAYYHRPISPAAGVGKTVEALCWDRGGEISKAT